MQTKSDELIATAVIANDVESLKLIFEFTAMDLSLDEIKKAANDNNFAKIKLLYSAGVPLCSYVFQMAITHENIQMLDWLNTNRCPKKCTRWAACADGKVKSLQWLLDNELFYSAKWEDLEYIRPAIANGHLAVVQWYDKNFSSWIKSDPLVTKMAAKCGQLEIFKYLITHGYAWDKRTYRGSIHYQHLKIAKWLRKYNGPQNYQGKKVKTNDKNVRNPNFQ